MEERLEHNKWSGKTGGTTWMQRSLIVCFRFVPLWLYYSALIFIVPFYMIFNRTGYNSTYGFFRKAFQYGKLKSFWFTYLNHFRFGQIIIDRFAKYAGEQFKFINESEKLFLNLSESQSSFIVLSAHLGNYEMAGYALQSKSKPVNALVYANEAVTVMENRSKQFSKTNIRMIAVKEDMSHLFQINSALCNGEIVSMPGDRLFGSSKSVECDFFGRKTKFPKGPFATIVQRNVPAIAMFVMKTGYKSYEIVIVSLTDELPADIDREARIETVSQRFAKAIETTLRKYPTQWFNYYDFWSE